MIGRKKIYYAATLACLFLPLLAVAQSKSSEDKEASAMIRQIYNEVSSDGKVLPDWDRVRSFFAEEAVIVLRTSRDGNTRFTLEEFIQDFKNFYQNAVQGNSGFKEEVLQLKSNIYHDIAFVAVLYEAAVLNSDRPPQKGIDFWLLARNEGSWKVVAVTNEIVRPGEDLPPPLTN
jgi:hypothetical protein